MREVHGTIRASEMGAVLRAVLIRRRVSPGIWKMNTRRLSILDGTEVVEVEVGRGKSYYDVQKAEKLVNEIIDRMEQRQMDRAHKLDKLQIDLEELIARRDA